MVVKCIGNRREELNGERVRDSYSRNIHQDEVWLEVGKLYGVYGVVFRDGEDIPWYLVVENGGDYPKAHLSEFFEIVDGAIPAGWMFTTSSRNVGEIALLPSRWASDPYFLEKLVDGDREALSYFGELKAQMQTIHRVPA